MFAKIANLLLTLYLAMFVIGGGRVCGCEILERAGVDLHHDHQHAHSHDHDECEHEETTEEVPLNDCCELAMEKRNMETSRTLQVPELSINEELYISSSLSLEDFLSALTNQIEGYARWKHPPPDLPTPTLSVIQRFTI